MDINKNMDTIGINSFVKRQTADSKFSHYDGSWESLVLCVAVHLDMAKPGYRDGVLEVPVPPEGFFSGVYDLSQGDEVRQLVASFEARRAGEEPYIDVVACDVAKQPAVAVNVILYRRDVLGDEASTDKEWEIVSINARMSEEPEPMNPVTMARNFLGAEGGTEAEYTAEQFAEAIVYWSKRVMIGG
jgi:hypothetical protein